MKKISYIFILLITVMSLSITVSAGATESPINFDKSNSITIPKGTFLKAVNQRELSTATMNEGDTVTFINPEPVYIRDYTVVPKGAIYTGYVEQINEAIEGVNALLKIKITKIMTPEGKEMNINAYVWSEGNNYIGGTLTPARFYKKTPHYIEGLRGGVLQYTPTSYRYVGTPTIVKPGTELFLILNNDWLYITK